MGTGRAIALLASLTLAVAACGDDADVSEGMRAEPSGGSRHESAEQEGCDIEGGQPGEPVAVVRGELTEYAIRAGKGSVPAGLVRFEFENSGGLAHEVAVVRADSASTVPTTSDGAAADDALGDDLIGELEPFDPGVTCAGTFDLAPGRYVLLCNVIEEHRGEKESHLARGMATTLRVTA